MATVRMVLHPRHGPGLAQALSACAAVDLITPDDPDGVETSLRSGAAALVTYEWEDRFLVSGLRWVQAISAGVDQFPMEDMRGRGVVLTSARGAHSPAVADHALALLFALIRGIGHAVRRGTRHEWEPRMASDSAGMVVGIIGLGSVGDEIARRLLALGNDVIGVTRHPDTYDGRVRRVVGPEQLTWVCEQADALICALPGGPETERLIGEPEFAALGRGWFVNVGRGSVVDEDALVAAVGDGGLAGAALDVTAVEPLPADSPLWDLDNVIVTPHMAWASDRLTDRLVEVVVANLRGYRGEGPWRTRVV